jgi:hypothetical protein
VFERKRRTDVRSTSSINKTTMKVHQIIAENETLNELGVVGKTIGKYASKVFKGPKKTLGEPATTAATAAKVSPTVAAAAKESVSKLTLVVSGALQAIGATALAYNYWTEFHSNEAAYAAYQKDPSAEGPLKGKSPEEAWTFYQSLQQEALGKLSAELTLLIGPGVVAKLFKYAGKGIGLLFPVTGNLTQMLGQLIGKAADPRATAGRAAFIAWLEGTDTGRAVMADGLTLAITGATGRTAQAIMDKMAELLQSYKGPGGNGVNALGKGVGAVSAASKGLAAEPPEVAASKTAAAANDKLPRILQVTKNGKQVRIGGVEVVDAQGKRRPGLESDQERAQMTADVEKIRNPWLDYPPT